VCEFTSNHCSKSLCKNVSQILLTPTSVCLALVFATQCNNGFPPPQYVFSFIFSSIEPVIQTFFQCSVRFFYGSIVVVCFYQHFGDIFPWHVLRIITLFVQQKTHLARTNKLHWLCYRLVFERWWEDSILRRLVFPNRDCISLCSGRSLVWFFVPGVSYSSHTLSKRIILTSLADRTPCSTIYLHIV